MGWKIASWAMLLVLILLAQLSCKREVSSVVAAEDTTPKSGEKPVPPEIIVGKPIAVYQGMDDMINIVYDDRTEKIDPMRLDTASSWDDLTDHERHLLIDLLWWMRYCGGFECCISCDVTMGFWHDDRFDLPNDDRGSYDAGTGCDHP